MLVNIFEFFITDFRLLYISLPILRVVFYMGDKY